MLISLIAGSLMAQAATPAPDTRVMGVSMFKNGYAVVVREAPISADGTVVIKQIPTSSLGTLWFTASSGVKLEEVVSSFQEKKGERDASSMDEILTANIGKSVRLGTRVGDAVTGEQIIGTIVSVSGQIVVLKNGKDMLAVPKTIVNSVASPTGELLYKMPTLDQERVLKIRTSGTTNGKVMMVSLERGMTWAPAYAVDISDPKTLSIVGKATVLNDLTDLDGIEARFVTGFPNIPFAALPDPLTSGQPVDQFIAMINGIGGGRGFGAPGAGRASEMMTQNAAAPSGDFFTSFDPVILPGQQEGELFFYRKADVHLKRGDRAYYVLFKAEAPYETLYTWDVDDSVTQDVNFRPQTDPSPDDVWQSLRFKNTAGQPFTTAAATTFKNGQILGQDMLRYTSAGAEARLRITKALDLRAEHSEEEKSRVRGALVLQNYGTYDLVTIEGSLQLVNMKTTTAKVKITKSFTGELVSATGDPKTTKLGKGLQQVNAHFGLEWTKDVEPGKKLTLTYTYKVYVR